MEIPYTPISTAPTDGTVILTDAGVVKNYAPGWVLCNPDGSTVWGPDDEEFYRDPKAWVPLPIWKLE